MRTKNTSAFEPWSRVGGPLAGTISALVLGEDSGYTLFIGTKVGLYRSVGFDKLILTGWERLPKAPIGILSLAVSPTYKTDHLVIAGTDRGIFYSTDNGDNWSAAEIPMERSLILAISFSPGYEADGIVVAGTLEDGILYSDTRGESWHLKSFGLLDAAVFSLGLSPQFPQDETIFAGTETAIYYSYNQARAWKQLPFPENVAPVLSLFISPDFAADKVIFAGTEAQGLFRSTDQGENWERLSFPAASVSALALSKEKILLAATEMGIYQSRNRGKTWQHLCEISNAISLAAINDIVLAGFVDQGLRLATDLRDWQPIEVPSIRSMVGFVLSSQFEKDLTAFMYGPQEGIWRSADGGITWNPINDALPSLDILTLIGSPELSESKTILAAFLEGLYISRDAGDHWQLRTAQPAGMLSFSPNGKKLIASFLEAGLRISEDLGQTWRDIPGPWEKGGKVVGLAISDLGDFHAALIEGTEESLGIWQGKPGRIEKVMDVPGMGHQVVSFWSPVEAEVNRPWFASAGNKVWKFSSRMGSLFTESVVFQDISRQESIFSLAGVQTSQGITLFACTGQHIYKSLDEETWTLVHEAGDEPIIQLILAPSYPSNKKAFLLLLGGSFCQGVLR